MLFAGGAGGGAGELAREVRVKEIGESGDRVFV